MMCQKTEGLCCTQESSSRQDKIEMSYRIVVLHRKTYNDDDESSGAGLWLERLVVADRRAAGVMDSHRPTSK